MTKSLVHALHGQETINKPNIIQGSSTDTHHLNGFDVASNRATRHYAHK
jgi:hypothetical protein